VQPGDADVVDGLDLAAHLLADDGGLFRHRLVRGARSDDPDAPAGRPHRAAGRAEDGGARGRVPLQAIAGAIGLEKRMLEFAWHAAQDGAPRLAQEGRRNTQRLLDRLGIGEDDFGHALAPVAIQVRARADGCPQGRLTRAGLVHHRNSRYDSLADLV